MRLSFNSRLIELNADIEGPHARTTARLVLDTGAARTVINWEVLESIGYTPETSKSTIGLTTASSNLHAPLVTLRMLSVFDIERPNFEVAAHSLPENANIDGLLGMDFLQGLIVILNLEKGWIEVKRAK